MDYRCKEVITMDEKKPEGKEKTIKDTDEGVQSETTTELDRADQIAERQKRENDRREELLVRDESLQARKQVGGVAEAGSVKEKPKRLTDEEYSDAYNKGEVDPFKEDGFS